MNSDIAEPCRDRHQQVGAGVIGAAVAAARVGEFRMSRFGGDPPVRAAVTGQYPSQRRSGISHTAVFARLRSHLRRSTSAGVARDVFVQGLTTHVRQTLALRPRQFLQRCSGLGWHTNGETGRTCIPARHRWPTPMAGKGTFRHFLRRTTERGRPEVPGHPVSASSQVVRKVNRHRPAGGRAAAPARRRRSPSTPSTAPRPGRPCRPTR